MKHGKVGGWWLVARGAGTSGRVVAGDNQIWGRGKG